MWLPGVAAITQLHKPLYLAMAVDSMLQPLPHLKSVGDTLLVSALISRVTLTFDHLTLKMVHVIARGVDNLSAYFVVSGAFRSRLIGQQLSD